MMQIKKIQAASVKDALAQIRMEFGSEAVILHTKTLEGAGDRAVEVTAGIDTDSNQKAPERPTLSTHSVRESQQETSKDVSQASTDIRKEMQQMQSRIDRLTKELQYPDVQSLPKLYREWYMHLVQQEVDLPLLKDLICGAQKSLRNDTTRQQLRHYMERAVDNIFEQSAPAEFQEIQQRIAIVGPTGVGKTTTIAKLAAQKTIEEGRAVALITADTFRVAATDQLKVFADLIDVPLEIVYTPVEMRQAVKKFADYDYIYIDTTGRSHNDDKNLSTMRRLVKAAQPDEVHLMLSATTSSATLQASAKRFSIFEITDLIISKLDEAETVGNVLTMLHRHEWPVSYFTTGQNVPEDISLGNSTLYCENLFGGLE